VNGTDNVLGLAQELGVPRAVYVSSTVYYGDSGGLAHDETFQRQKPYRFYYEQSKAEAHAVALKYQQSGLPLVIVCPAHVLGPNDHSNFGYFLRVYLNRLMSPVGFSPEMMFSPAHVADIAEGIALAAEKGRLGETYILTGEPIARSEVLNHWNSKPGGFKVRFYIPSWLAWLTFAPLEPLQRWAGLPAAISRETVTASVSLNFSNAKAKRELGWTHLPTKEMWLSIIDDEIKLLAQRPKRDLVSRLKPVPADK
jgi:dihydroflavonol-4-reductase